MLLRSYEYYGILNKKLVPNNQTPQTRSEPEASEPCSWWRRGRVERYLKHGLALIVAVSWAGVSPVTELTALSDRGG